MYSKIWVLSVALILSFILELVLQKFWIAKMRLLKIKQVTKIYGPSWHEKTKTGTPTMGGIVFIPALLISLFCASVFNIGFDFKDIILVSSYPILAALVGFADDWLKYRRGSADGFTSIQKFSLQTAATLLWVFFIAPDGAAYVSLLRSPAFSLELPPAAGVALLVFAGVGLQNAVNVTDGLDGLAAGCAAISAAAAFLLGNNFAVQAMLLASFGICVAFLWHNANPAAVFMGDTGAHFIAGVIFTACALSDNFLFIIPVSFIFGAEMISVIIQITAIRFFKKRVFLMSPVHHHFEMLGWSETQIVTRFWITHFMGFLAIMMALRFFL